ncbi:hypothetical protein [Streptomyces sp. NPDC006645]|uniref:hypothetical protein n=1 Tax=unclassified Streptomyces TaxID=2593676 RepID=UPI0033A54CCC
MRRGEREGTGRGALLLRARAAVAHATAYRGLATSLMRAPEDETSALYAAPPA